MLEYDNAYSRLVAWLKIFLPLTALAILSTLFLFSRNIQTDGTLPYSESDIRDLAREPRMTAPNFAGVTEDGAAVSVSAGSATPAPGDTRTVSAVGIAASLETPDGERTDVEAASGRIDGPGQMLSLDGGVTIRNSAGYVIRTEAATSSLNRTAVETMGPIEAESPLGTLNAGQLHIGSSTEDGGGYVLVFKGGVKLVYDPKD